MGYYSEVGLVLYKKDYEDLMAEARKNKFLKKWLDQGIGMLLNKEPILFEDEGETFAYLHTDCVKWYAGFEEPDLVDSFIANHPHCFIRIGEESGDIEESMDKGENDCWTFVSPICVRSTIDFNYGFFQLEQQTDDSENK